MNLSLTRFFAFGVMMLVSLQLSAQNAQSLTANKNLSAIRSDRSPVGILATEKEKMEVAQAIDNVEFAFDQAVISTDSFIKLDGLAAWLMDKAVTLRVSGFADEIGTAKYNSYLSAKRARAVKDYLVSKGADAKLIDPVAFGERNPVAANDTEAGRQKNRRVEFALY